jgi:hypothetical protein
MFPIATHFVPYVLPKVLQERNNGLERLKKKKKICSVSGFRVFWESVSENLEAAAAASFVRGGERESFCCS